MIGGVCSTLVALGGCASLAPTVVSAGPGGEAVAAAQVPAPEALKAISTPVVASPVAIAPEPAVAPISPLRPKPAPKLPAAAAPRPPQVTAPPIPATAAVSGPAVPVAPATPALNLTALEQRLRDTHAVGVFTKLSLKNQVDDLLDQFRAYYRGQVKSPMAPLRQRYDLLLLKVLSLLQDGDPPLAAAILSSREGIWNILADPQKFSQI